MMNSTTAELTACIFNIQRFSVSDGPGVRTTVFFKGCNMRCAWCHNPESLSPVPQVEINPDKCIGCGACARVCPANAHNFAEGGHTIDRDKCVSCGECADKCYAEALVMAGKQQNIDDVMREIMDDELYYKHSGGGVTFSGGECMLQAVFLHELLRRCKAEGLHTAIDTAGNVPWPLFETMLPMADLFLYDIKAATPAIHKTLTGADNTLILSNLGKLSDSGANILIRIPIIPGCNDNGDELRKIAEICARTKNIGVELLPYHRLGEGKYKALDMEYRLAGTVTPEKQKMQQYIEIFRESGVHARENA